jgi:hypothetical protein
MDRIEQSLCPPLRLRWEWTPLQLGGDTIGAELVDMLDVGDPLHHSSLL